MIGFSRNIKNSFSLVETLLAISLLLIGTIGVTSLMSTAIRTANATRSNLIAAQLAQEGIEIIRKDRDGNFIALAPFQSGGLVGTHRIDWINGKVPPSPSNQFLKYDSQYGYNYTTGSTTAFERNVYITQPSTNELKVEVEIIWKDRGATKSFITEDHLFDWR